jgi:hypothetical protein
VDFGDVDLRGTSPEEAVAKHFDRALRQHIDLGVGSGARASARGSAWLLR